MIPVKDLIEALSRFPEDATAVAHDAHGCGLVIQHGDKYGWVETGRREPADPNRHEDLSE